MTIENRFLCYMDTSFPLPDWIVYDNIIMIAYPKIEDM